MEENTNGELTFKMIWLKVKKSAVRMLVYGIITLIVVGGILGICDIFVSQSQYETRITYYYSGAELGNDPWGGKEDVVSDIKSASNVSSALESLQYSDEEKDALVNLVVRNLNIIATVANEVLDEAGGVVSADYNYRIVLSQDPAIDKLLKSRNDYNNIVSAVTTNYIDNFKKKFSFGTSLTQLAIVDNYNAFQKFNAIKSYMNAFSEESNTWAQKAPGFISTTQNMSFKSLNARIQAIDLKLDNYLNFILFNGINVHGETKYIDLKLKEASDQIAIYEEEIKSLNEVLSLLMQNNVASLPSTGNTIVVTPPDTKAVTQAISLAITNKTLAETEKNVWENYKNYFNTQDFLSKTEEERKTLSDAAAALEKEVIQEYNTIMDSYKKMIEEYNTGYNVSSLVRMTAVPTQATNSPITTRIAVVVELVALLLAVIVAIIVTSKKGAMVLKRKALEEQAQVVLIENQKENAPNAIEQKESDKDEKEDVAEKSEEADDDSKQ